VTVRFPRAVLIAGAESATPAEAAAIVAALARFARESAVPIAAQEQAVDPWWRAALLEGVGCDEGSDDPIGTWQGWINA
jgi:hypothetical protein